MTAARTDLNTKHKHRMIIGWSALTVMVEFIGLYSFISLASFKSSLDPWRELVIQISSTTLVFEVVSQTVVMETISSLITAMNTVRRDSRVSRTSYSKTLQDEKRSDTAKGAIVSQSIGMIASSE
eukprot:jgi/Hompol1/3377/HPOL_003215-RA